MPNIHPVVVHFPIALLTVGLIAEIAGFISREGDRDSKLGLWLQASGTLGLLLAVGTGIFAGQSAGIQEGAEGVFDVHQQGAFVSAALFALLALWRVGCRGRIPEGRRLPFLLTYAAGVAILLITGWYGGKLVFEYGVGVVGGAGR